MSRGHGCGACRRRRGRELDGAEAARAGLAPTTELLVHLLSWIHEIQEGR